MASGGEHDEVLYGRVCIYYLEDGRLARVSRAKEQDLLLLWEQGW